jgi:hypothetical protein
VVAGLPPTPTLTPTPTATWTPVPPGKRETEDDTKKETKEQRQQRQQTNAGNRDDVHTEGNVATVERDGDTLVILVALRDGIQRVIVTCVAGGSCPDVRAGDYLEAEGTKENETLFYADEISVTRDGRRVGQGWIGSGLASRPAVPPLRYPPDAL